ncbi:AraC family transcriptional regulator [Algivirga pacifica]|uniref:AraC family transcriptional regulator n=1 Tax=Algivirga pacifica TaxID=1162670 RepID=A0ABP9DE05_9BACT
MKDFFKYLLPNPEDKKWPVYLTVAGTKRINEHILYPDVKHPSGYYFDWEKGRILKEYQLNYISAGKGVFETKDRHYEVEAGSLLLLRPNQWHRYRPDSQVGWTENYIGFDGEQATALLTQQTFYEVDLLCLNPSYPFLGTLHQLFEEVQQEQFGYQQVATGLLLQFLGQVIAANQLDNIETGQKTALIQKAKILLKQHLQEEVDMQRFCQEEGVSYSYFRKSFREYTGFSPHQYHLHWKLLKAKELLLVENKQVKEVAYSLGFSSIHYFSRLFKQKMGMNPTEVRKG